MKNYIGEYVKKFESGARGCIALGSCGNDWGLSCGTYQLTLRWGNCIYFLKAYYPIQSLNLYYNNLPDIVTPNYPGINYCSSPDAVKYVWMICYNLNPVKFQENEHKHIKGKYYDKVITSLKSIYTVENRAMQECLWSWGIHKGVSGAVNGFKRALNNLNISSGNSISNKTLLFDVCYDIRYAVNNFTRYKRNAGNASERETLRKYIDVIPLGIMVINKCPYLITVNANKLNVRTGAGTDYPIVTENNREVQIENNGMKYTIIEEKNGWGKLKSGVGWIKLSYTKKCL